MEYSKLFLILMLLPFVELSAKGEANSAKSASFAQNKIEFWIPKKEWIPLLDQIISVNPAIIEAKQLFKYSAELNNLYEKCGFNNQDFIARERLNKSISYCLATIVLLKKIAPYVEFNLNTKEQSLRSLKKEFVESVTSSSARAYEKFEEIFVLQEAEAVFIKKMCTEMLLEDQLKIINNKAHDGYFLPDYDIFLEDLFKILFN